MKFFNKPLLVISIVTLSFFLVNESFTYYMGLERAKKVSYEKDRLILNNLIIAQEKNVQILAEILAVDKEVKKAYVLNDPELLKQHVAPIWDRVRDKKLTHEIHFFKPPAISFVNFSNFNSIGKDVSSVRTDIEWVTSSFKTSTHALMCKTYAGLRATHPIIGDDGEMLGGLSLGKKIDWIPEAIKERTKHDSFLVYTKNSTNSLASKYYEHFMHNKKIIGEYILADKTLNVSEENIKNIDFTKMIQVIEIEKKKYTLYSFPIIDFNKKTMGYLCTVTQLEEFTQRFTQNLIKNIIILLLTAILVFVIARQRISTLLKEIGYINETTKEIKNGDFSSAHNNSKESKFSYDSLVELENNVIEIGRELEKD